MPKAEFDRQYAADRLGLSIPSSARAYLDDPSKWSGLNAFAFAVEVKRVAEIQSDFVASAKS